LQDRRAERLQKRISVARAESWLLAASDADDRPVPIHPTRLAQGTFRRLIRHRVGETNFSVALQWAQPAANAGGSREFAIKERDAFEAAAGGNKNIGGRVDSVQRERLARGRKADPVDLVTQPLAGRSIDLRSGPMEALLRVIGDDARDRSVQVSSGLY